MLGKQRKIRSTQTSGTGNKGEKAFEERKSELWVARGSCDDPLATACPTSACVCSGSVTAQCTATPPSLVSCRQIGLQHISATVKRVKDYEFGNIAAYDRKAYTVELEKRQDELAGVVPPARVKSEEDLRIEEVIHFCIEGGRKCESGEGGKKSKRESNSERERDVWKETCKKRTSIRLRHLV